MWLLIVIIWQTQSYSNPCALIGSFRIRSGFCSTDRFCGNGPTRVFLFWSEAGKFKTAKKNCEYCHSSHWNYQKKLKRLKFFRNFKDGWRRRTFWSASHRKCILLSETECHIINNLLTELARAVPGNIGPRSFSYGPRCARSLSRRNARVSCNQEKLRHPERALDLKTKDSLVLTKPYCSLANHNPELRCVICTVLHFLLWYFWYYTFLHSCYTFCTPFSANQNWIIFSCILLTWLQADSAPQHLLKGNKGLKSGRQIWPARLHMRNTFDRGVVY